MNKKDRYSFKIASYFETYPPDKTLFGPFSFISEINSGNKAVVNLNNTINREELK